MGCWPSGTARKLSSTDPVSNSSELGLALKAGKYRNIAVIAGAGISVSAGIPDFRSESGLYQSFAA
jgi:hypothetical protein